MISSSQSRICVQGEKKKVKNKGSKVRRDRKNWQSNEVEKILEYMKDTILNGNDIEHPNAPTYYGIMLAKLELPNCDTKAIINKVRLLKGTYDKAIEWRNGTGQGVESQTTVREYLLKICKNFDILDEIYATRSAKLNIYNSETINVGLQNKINDGDIENFGQTVDVEEMNDLGYNNDSAKQSHQQSTSNATSSEPQVPINEKQSVTKKRSKEQSEFALIVTKRQALQMEEIQLSREKLEVEKEKLKLDAKNNEKNTHLEQLKFNLQQQSVNSEIEHRREMLQFEREKLDKMNQLDLEKFKIEQSFKLELAKLQKQ